MRGWLVAACALSTLELAACGDKYARDCSSVEGEVTYATVQPVFERHCTRCHAEDRTGSQRKGAPRTVNFDSYEEASANAEDANGAILSGRMPPNDPESVSDAEGCLIEAWIDQGLQP